MNKHYADEDVKRVIEAWKSRNICQHERDREPDKEFPVWVCEDCDSRAILDAVAPAIAARALREAAKAIRGQESSCSVKRTCHFHDTAILNARADEIEAGR